MRNDNQPKDDNYAYEAFTDEFKRRFDQLPDKQIHELLDLVRSKIMEAYLQGISDATVDVWLDDETNQREITNAISFQMKKFMSYLIVPSPVWFATSILATLRRCCGSPLLRAVKYMLSERPLSSIGSASCARAWASPLA